MIRESKQHVFDRIADNLKSDSRSCKDWWKTLKTFIVPNSNSSIPPLEFNGRIYTVDCDKANAFYNYFQSQTLLDDSNAKLPDLPPPSYHSQLSHLMLKPIEVESILRTLNVDKASGPDDLNNRILKECELYLSYCSLFNQSLHMGIFPSLYKDANVSPVPKKGDMSVVSNHRRFRYLILEQNYLKN